MRELHSKETRLTLKDEKTIKLLRHYFILFLSLVLRCMCVRVCVFQDLVFRVMVILRGQEIQDLNREQPITTVISLFLETDYNKH